MANRSDGRKFVSTSHPPDRFWMESGQTRPSWGLGVQGIREWDQWKTGTDWYHPSQGGASVMRMMERYGTDVKRNVDNVQWDDSQKRILFESEDLESISSGSDSQEVRPGWPPDDMCADSTRCRQSFSEQERRDSSC